MVEGSLIIDKKEEVNIYTEEINKLFLIQLFLKKCILKPNYQPSKKYGEAIHLTEEGTNIIKETFFKDINNNTYEILPEMKLAMFILSINLLDLKNTNIQLLMETLDEEIRNRNIFFPYIFGRELYDKFSDKFNDAKNLDYRETLVLLEHTSKGVFQLNQMIVGPFGMIQSQTSRYLFPTLGIPVFHCSDTSCNDLHKTTICSDEKSIITDLSREILEKNFSSIIQIREASIKLSNMTTTYNDNNLDSLICLIGIFPTEELKILLTSLIDNEKEIRKSFPCSLEFENLGRGDGEKITSSLSHSECLQLIMILDNEKIAHHIEKLIFENKIHIPVTEIRESHFNNYQKNFFKTNIECSKYGIRSKIHATNSSLGRLKNLILKLYSSNSMEERLIWKLRNISTSSLSDKLEEYLLKEDPREIVRNLIFDNHKYVEETFKFLQYGFFNLMGGSENEDYLVNKILWKLGFDSIAFPEYLKVFWKRHFHFEKTIQLGEINSEIDRENIRSAAVNYFVSIEEVLDYSLSFITWALLSDHYIDTQFKFNLEDARNFTSNKINQKEYKINAEEVLYIDKDGKNTLFPLIKGFTVVAEICEDYILNKKTFERDISEFPVYHNQTEVYKFPFIYNMFFMNLNQSEMSRFIENLKEITNVLEKNKISNIRNRIKHNRPIHEFPSLIELENVSNTVKEVISLMETEGIIPQFYMFRGKEIDQFGRSITKLVNYNNTPYNITYNFQFKRCGLPNDNESQIIIPNLHLENSREKPRFYYTEQTLYSTFWRNYPARKIDRKEIQKIIQEVY